MDTIDVLELHTLATHHSNELLTFKAYLYRILYCIVLYIVYHIVTVMVFHANIIDKMLMNGI